MQQYRRLLGLPGVRGLLVLIFFAKIAPSAAGMALTLHVAVGLERGYGAAGTVVAAGTVGIALGAPVWGRVVDRFGLRPMVVVTMLGETLFWLGAGTLPYPLLVAAALPGGFLVLPATSVGRQAIAAAVPDGTELRRSAYSLDSVSTELSYMVGPAVMVLLATQFTTHTTLLAMAAGIALVGLALLVVNPPVLSEQERTAGEEARMRPPRRSWLTPRMIAVLLIGAGAVFILSGTEVGIVAALRHGGELGWTGVVVIVWSAVSAIGGLVYGALRRSVGQVTLMALLGLCTIPIGLAGGHWWVLTLALLPAAALCAPTIAATGEEVARLAPSAARGEATGWQASAFTAGAAAGAPVIGFVVDHSSPAWGFAVAGIGGVLVATVAAALIVRRRAGEPLASTPVV